MPQPVLESTVHHDWQTLTQENSMRRLRLWRAIEIVVALMSLVALTVPLLFPSWPGARILPFALFSLAFWILPIWTLLRTQMTVGPALLRILPILGLLLAAMLIAIISAPAAVTGNEGQNILILSAMIPALTWPVLAWLVRRFPTRTRALGFTTMGWPANLVIGAAAGAALGLHLLFSAGLTMGLAQPSAAMLTLLVWTLCFQAGLLAVGEEILFRGLAYDLLIGSQPGNPIVPGLRIVLLNSIVYLGLWPSFNLQGVSGVFWFLAYSVVLALLTTYLRYRQRSLLPGMVCRIVFATLAILIFAT
ncbi:MAG: CPBP family glutamic-type intramembrane protease [Chloroflexota bacterium]|nr:CPBP family glutamic-type intramembrane protease [Chloroflexota bacterium]